MRKNLLPYFIFFIFSGLFYLPLNATHIVGGEMTYTCLGNDQYEIELTIFRDCYNGNPAAYFDDPAKIGIYDANGILLDSLFIPFDLMLDDTLNPVLSDPCLVVPPNVCVHTTHYTGTVTLPVIPGGYQLIYQRCCRNMTIVNIVGPLDTGATFGVNISEAALNECNSSAKFTQWPPIYICVNEPINFDQSAIDADGDSIVYRLCTPLDGATPLDPEPIPSNQTVPSPVVWVDPPYNESDMLGGIPLAINEQTGWLTGTPNTVGQFVVGICLEEYRNGVLISTTRRDFQYNVGICGVPFSSFFAPEIICEGLTVYFDNQSEDADQFEWHFNDPEDPGYVSNEENPTYTFSDTGTYNIMLIAQPGSNCADTFEQEINLQLPSLFADFDFGYTNCTDSLTIEVSDLSYDTISEVVSWEWWLVSQAGDTLGVSNLQNPTFTVTTSTDVTLNLLITAANGCTQELSQGFPANVFTEESFPDEVTICFDEGVPLNPNPLPGVTYVWSPTSGLTFPGSPNSPIASPVTTTTYVVHIDNLGFCELYDTVTVIVDSIAADFTVDVPCDFEVFFMDNSYNAENYTWYFNDPINPLATSMEMNPSFIYSDTGNFTAMLVVDIGEYCVDTAYQDFYIDDPLILPDFDYEVLNCVDSFTLGLTDMTVHLSGLNFSWNWYISVNGMLADSSTLQNPELTVPTSGLTTIELIITDSEGCRGFYSETLTAQVNPGDYIPDELLLCGTDTVQLNTDPYPGLVFSWSPSESLSDPNAASPFAFPGMPTTYIVTMEDQYGCMFTDTVQVDIDDAYEVILDGYVEMDTILTGDTTQIFVTDDPDYVYNWEFSESLSELDIFNPLVFPTVTTTYNLEVQDQNGCTNTIQFLVVVTESLCIEPNIFLPNAFTPNNDGENDVLKLLGRGIDEMYLAIYNRWGQKVFESDDPAIGWDGTFKGEELEPDVYGFYLQVRCFNGDDFFKKGNIALLK